MSYVWAFEPRRGAAFMEKHNGRTCGINTDSVLVRYDREAGIFRYPAKMQAWFDADFDGRPLWRILEDAGIASKETAQRIRSDIERGLASEEAQADFAEYRLKGADGLWKKYRIGYICVEPGKLLSIVFTAISDEPYPAGILQPREKDADKDAALEDSLDEALNNNEFVVYYQPQYNHATGMLVGAEALVRWDHPVHGLVTPDAFIPMLEEKNLIYRLDYYVFEQACICLRRCMDAGMALVGISVNFSRYDIFRPDFAETLERIRSRYDIPVKYLRVEITESAVMGSNRQTADVVKKLHEHGYVVEMDDFGTGYSSLNVLKDIEVDVLKLDMLFLSEDGGHRGGTILSSIVRMAKWLGMPVIAEGVETLRQADFLRSIGCDYIQGYLYSRPLPWNEFEELLSRSAVGVTKPELKLIENLNAGNFWDPESLETLIFSNYVGGAAIFDYHDDTIEVLRVNQKYLRELGMNLSEKELISKDPMAVFDETNRKVYLDMLDRAVETGEEQECETWRTLTSSCCGAEKFCIRTTVRMIGKSDTSILFYAMIRNITAEKRRYIDVLDSERRFKMASEQVNIYYWEYTVATREMRPCFRCMRDLGLPALLTNYPDSAIEMGVFPPEVADMYRDWHRQIAEGVRELEAVIPLTVGRVPFRVRYTTEFDENGRPVKAYGSAALVV